MLRLIMVLNSNRNIGVFVFPDVENSMLRLDRTHSGDGEGMGDELFYIQNEVNYWSKHLRSIRYKAG